MGRFRGAGIFLALLPMLLLLAVANSATIQDYELDSLNYWNSSEMHNLSVTIASSDSLTVQIPSGFFNKSASSGCSWTTSLIAHCSGSAFYWVTFNSSAASSFETKKIKINSSDHTPENITMVAVDPTNVWETQVQLGKGDLASNTYSTKYGGTIYLPASTDTRITIIHHLKPTVMHHLSNNEDGSEPQATCMYPSDYYLINMHPDDSTLASESSKWKIIYNGTFVWKSADKLFFSDWDIPSRNNGTAYEINCTVAKFKLDENHGFVKVAPSAFNLTFITPESLSLTVTPSTSTVKNGKQEIVYNVKLANNAPYAVDSVKAELRTQNGNIVGINGDLAGIFGPVYLWELPEIGAVDSRSVNITVRFDIPSDASNGATPDFFAKVRFYPIWAKYGKTPIPVIQSLSASDVVTVNTAQTATGFVDVKQTLLDINGTVNTIKTNTQVINDTINRIETAVNTVNSTVNTIKTSTDTSLTRIQEVKDLVNCSNSTSSTVCDKLNNITSNLGNVNSTVINLRDEVRSNFTSVIGRFDRIDGNISQVKLDIANVTSLLNCSNQTGVCAKLSDLNSTVYEIVEDTRIMTNASNFGRYTLSNISSSVSGINTRSLEAKIDNIREFDQELPLLITDAVGAQQKATQSIIEGDLATAVEELKHAMENYQQIDNKLNGPQIPTGLTSGVYFLILGIAVVVGSVIIYSLMRSRNSFAGKKHVLYQIKRGFN